jgi:hypothetical protein
MVFKTVVKTVQIALEDVMGPSQLPSIGKNMLSDGPAWPSQTE